MDLEKNLRTAADTKVCDCVYVFLSFVISHVDGAHCILRIYSIMKRFIQDFLYYYKRFGPKYGWFWSIEWSIHNSRCYTRDGEYKGIYGFKD